MTFEAENDNGAQPEKQIGPAERDHYRLYRETGPGLLIDVAGITFETAPGDLVVYDGDAPMLSRAEAQFGHDGWMIPRAVLDLYLAPGPRPLVAHIPAAGALTALITAYVEALAGPARNLTEPQATAVADNLARLVAMACASLDKPDVDAPRAVKLDQARRHIQRHISSPDLDPATVAAGLGISPRQLHILFEPTGESFSAYLRRVRLEGCRGTLQNPMAADRSVADIAFGWGFSSLPTFYRAFQATYGMTPGDVREAAGHR